MHDRYLPARPSDARLDIVEQELQDFSYMVSHDLAATFRHMSAFARLFLSEFDSELTNRQRTYARHVQQANQKCQSMMEQLLVFSRAQQRVLEPVRLDATAVMEAALKQFAGEAQAIGAQVVIEPLGEVYADPELLALMFRHLLSNALKFRRPVGAARIAICATTDEDYWRLRIRDNGVGVEPEYRERAFRMFQRLNREEAYPGVGAGLAICRRVAHRHGGETQFIDCDDGACVELALPHASASASSCLQEVVGASALH
jgi:light-regulated signal transduction histidine kinase (bacteriophytochrome)